MSMTSSRPIMAPSDSSKRASKRYSAAYPPSVSESTTTMSTHGDSRLRTIKELSHGLDRLSSAKLQQQRYSPSSEKADFLATLALGAKVERALGRRMTSQDAVMRPKSIAVLSEKA